MPPTVLVTGANGFVGRSVCRALAGAGYHVRAGVRTPDGSRVAFAAGATSSVIVGDIGETMEWGPALEGADVIIHLAARVHVLHETAGDALARFRAVNVAGTRRLAESADRLGVRRIVHASSIKVNGDVTTGEPFRETDPPAPADAYGISKWEGEQALRAVAARGSLEVVIVRSPLVYGPGVGGNIRTLLRAIARGVPLPVRGIRNRRSLVGVDNLADLLVRCVESPEAAGETFLASDGEDLSTPELIGHLAAGLGRPARLFWVPDRLVAAGAALLGYHAPVDRLWGSLQIEGSKARVRLGWRPAVPAADGLRRTGAGFGR